MARWIRAALGPTIGRELYTRLVPVPAVRSPLGPPGTEREVQPLFDALEDADCRQILGVLADESFTAKEVSDACGLPLSSTYRKLGLLTDGDLVVEGTRILPDGRHVTEYSRVVDDVAISVGGATGLEISVSYREPVDRPPIFGSRPQS